MRKIIPYRGPAGLAGLALALAGCGLVGVSGLTTGTPAGAPVTITQGASPSALIAVVNGPACGAALSGLADATARSLEEVAVLRAGTPPETVISSAAPAPPTVTVAGKPAAPGGGETSYQEARYASRLKHWQDAVVAGRRAEAARARDALSAWVAGLRLGRKVGQLASVPGAAGSLAAEAATAASALAGLAEEDGNVFGSRRVIVLYSDGLAGRLPAGELAGDTVIVVTSFLPSAAIASAAQADLLAAGAAQAAVAGPEVTSARLAALVRMGLRQGGMHESVSAPVLFANNSAALSARAVATLTALLADLRGAGATAVINGFASATGTAVNNYTLSYDRASAVADFLRSRGVPPSSLIIVGHGATDLVASGSSGQNRRVVVIIEKT